MFSITMFSIAEKYTFTKKSLFQSSRLEHCRWASGTVRLAPGWPRATRKRKASRLAHAHTWCLLKNRLSTYIVC